MRHLYLFILFMISLSSLAQTGKTEVRGYIQGAIFDEKTKEPIASATIRLLNQSDSSYIQGVASNDKGEFRLSALPRKYILEVSFIGYKTFLQNFNTTVKNPDYSTGDIYLEEDMIELGAAVVEAQVPSILVRGDTIEYNAGSYSSQESDMLQDMLKNIPGVEVDANGNITANGKAISKILVDGKEFFGNDIPMALANLPANMIKKLQLYKEQSETAKVTGFRDKDPEQVLNLVVKEELKQSTFGDVKGGYGSDDKYANKVLVNHMRGDNQLSFVGDMNNVSDDEYMSGMDNGIDKNKNVGVNAYAQVSEKFKIGGNVRYSDNENLMETKTNTQTFLSTGDRLAKQDMSSTNKRDNMNVGMNVQWKPDTLTTIFARSYVSFNNTESDQTSTNFSYVAEKDTTSGQSTNRSKGDGYSINNYFTVGRKLNNKGRTVSLSFNNSLRKENSKGTNYSYTTYTGDVEDKIIDQRTNTDNNSNSYNISMSYVEPLGKDYRLQLSYSYGLNDSERIRDVRKRDAEGNYTLIDSAYARNTENTYINQNISLNFQATKEKYRYTIGFSVDPSRSRSKISLGDSIIENLRQSVVNFSPSLNFSYTPNERTNIDFNYSGSTGQPGISQLSADTVIVNALSKYYGNPNLKPSYSNNFNVFYQNSDYESSRFLMLMGGFNYTFNNIVDYTLIDEQGNSINTYRNVSGNMGANINFMYNTPLKNKKFTVTNNSTGNYYKNIGYTNGEKAITHNVVLAEQVSVRFKNDKFETNLRAGVSY
ncbi:MAG: TonB-dependent receptor, partial [Prevotella sp.]|nr:TonB-dependent receptor [Prevotella sp.]